MWVGPVVDGPVIKGSIPIEGIDYRLADERASDSEPPVYDYICAAVDCQLPHGEVDGVEPHEARYSVEHIERLIN